MIFDRMRGLPVLLLCASIAWLCVADAIAAGDAAAADAATADQEASASEAAADGVRATTPLPPRSEAKRGERSGEGGPEPPSPLTQPLPHDFVAGERGGNPPTDRPQRGAAAAAVADAEAVDPTAVRLDLPETMAKPRGAAARKQMRFDRIVATLGEPPHHASRSEIRNRLAALIRDTSDLALLTADPRERLDAYALHMQALHAYITIFPQDPRVESYLVRLRNTAAQAKQLDDAEAVAVADFWQLTADLVEINRSGASIDEQRDRMLPLLSAYYEAHAGHPAAYAVGQMVEHLREDGVAASPQQADVTETPAASPRAERQEQEVRPGFVVPFDFDQVPVE